MSRRSTIVAIGVFFFAYCAFIAVFTFLGRNKAVYHLTNNYMLLYGAVYVILSPFGISGVLGVSHRRRSLIKGFIFQYWVGAAILTAINITSLLVAHKYQARTFIRCLTPFRKNLTREILGLCYREVRQAQMFAFVFTIVQGGVMAILGIVLLVFGKRECEDIQIDEETSTLLHGRRQTLTFPENTETEQPLRPQNVLRVDRVPGLYEKGFNDNQYYYPQTMYNDSAAGGGARHSGPSRYPIVTSNYTSAAMAQNDPELTRNPTVASNYTTATAIPQNGRRLSRNITGASIQTDHGLTRNPTVASNYTTATTISQNSRGVSRNPTGASAQNGLTRNPTVASNYTTSTTASASPLNRHVLPPLLSPPLLSPPPRIATPDLGRGSHAVVATAPEHSYSSRTRAQQLVTSPSQVQQPLAFEDTNALPGHRMNPNTNNSFIPSQAQAASNGINTTTEYWRPGMAKTFVPNFTRTPYNRG